MSTSTAKPAAGEAADQAADSSASAKPASSAKQPRPRRAAIKRPLTAQTSVSPVAAPPAPGTPAPAKSASAAPASASTKAKRRPAGPKTAKAAARPSSAKPVPTAKPAVSVKPVSSAKAAPADKERKPKAKLVRDSFTMPQADFDLIATLKQRALVFQRPAKKSELLRAGLHALLALGDVELRAALDDLTPLKPGRPKRID